MFSIASSILRRPAGLSDCRTLTRISSLRNPPRQTYVIPGEVDDFTKSHSGVQCDDTDIPVLCIVNRPEQCLDFGLGEVDQLNFL